MGMTMAEKILSRASGRDKVVPGEYVTATVDVIMGHDGTFPRAYELMKENGFSKIKHPSPFKLIFLPFMILEYNISLVVIVFPRHNYHSISRSQPQSSPIPPWNPTIPCLTITSNYLHPVSS